MNAHKKARLTLYNSLSTAWRQKNVRKTQATEADDAELHASIDTMV